MSLNEGPPSKRKSYFDDFHFLFAILIYEETCSETGCNSEGIESFFLSAVPLRTYYIFDLNQNLKLRHGGPIRGWQCHAY